MTIQQWPLCIDCVHFVDSVNSEEFSLFLRAMDNACVVAMDAEWKPVRSNSIKTFHRVSIMQIACRLSNHDEATPDNEIAAVMAVVDDNVWTHNPNKNDINEGPLQLDDRVSAEGGIQHIESAILNEDVVSTIELGREGEGSTTSGSYVNRGAVGMSAESPSSGLVSKEGEKCVEVSLSRLREKQEMIFLLDMMSLPVNSFWEAMKRMLVSPSVLKLGFKFKQDLVNLSKSFPGPDAHSCFDKVDPYVDIGKLFLGLYGWQGESVNSLSLATICEQVVGYTLCKDLQCSNWEQRPLTVEQQVYAAADAHCLLVAYDVFQLQALKDQDCTVDYTSNSTLDGIGILLLDSRSPLRYSSCNILHAHHGVATTMIKAAASLGMLVTAGHYTVNASSNRATCKFFVQKFGERLLLSEECVKKSTKKKAKNGSVSGRVKREFQVAAQGCYEPPPWDSSCGGDGTPKFLCDTMIEGLGKQLRNVGFDTIIVGRKKSDPRRMVEVAEMDGRVFLTQDAKLLCRRLFPPNLTYHVKSLGKNQQLAEVVKRFDLKIQEDKLLSRCVKCNGEFFPNPLKAEEALAAKNGSQSFPEYVCKEPHLFWQCSKCNQMYWQGKQFYRALETFQAFARKVQISEDCG